MGDEEIAEAEPLLEVEQQVDDLRLHRHVERRYRFVADDEVRLQRQRARDADALSLAAGKFVGETVATRTRQTDHLQQLADAIVAGGARQTARDVERLRDRVLRAHAGIERILWVLK